MTGKFQNHLVPLQSVPPPALPPISIVGYTSRASVAAGCLGYSTETIKFLEVISKHVHPAFWSQSLSQSGYNDEDLDLILRALIQDAA